MSSEFICPFIAVAGTFPRDGVVQRQLLAIKLFVSQGTLTVLPVQVIQILSAYGADMGVMTLEGSTALHYAAYGGFTNCCRFLAQRGTREAVSDRAIYTAITLTALSFKSIIVTSITLTSIALTAITHTAKL